VIRKLIIGNGRSEREILLVGNIVIGRDPACHISEPDPLLSRRHAEIIANVHGVSVRDLDSRNGILVNGEKTREQVLLPGDVVQLGHLQLRYVEDQPQPVIPATSSAAGDSRQGPPRPAPTYDIDRFRTEPTPRPATPTPQPGRWKPEPTPLPGRRTSAPPTPSRVVTPPLRGRAAFDETVAVDGGHDTTIAAGPPDLDSTMLAPPRDASGSSRWSDPEATMYGSPAIAEPGAPGDATFATALAHLQDFTAPANEQLRPGPGARLVANAELTVTDATPQCAELLGVPGEQLVGDSLPDVFLRGVRRAYGDPSIALSMTVTHGARGSITVTFTMDKISGTE
jgi:hypothetical protein